MKERILRLSGAFELTIVLLLAFGLTVPGNLMALLSPSVSIPITPSFRA
jgi:hypothetical protein